jgi:hypothetical protein
MVCRGVVIVLVLSLMALCNANAVARSPDDPPNAPTPIDVTTSPRDSGAAEIYDRLGEAFRKLDADFVARVGSNTTDPRLIYLETGSASPLVERWLVAARRLGTELAETNALVYQREIDLRAGYTLGPAHLASVRTIGRSLAFLVQDAALRADRTAIAELLRTQVALTLRSASDGTLPTSMLAVVIAQEHLAAVDGLLERAALDAATAQQVLTIRAALLPHADLGLITAARGEIVALQSEVDRLLSVPSAERPTAVIGIRGTIAADFDDNRLLAARAGADVYLHEAAEALEGNDLQGARAEVAALQERLRDGAFGDLLKVLAPHLVPTIDILIEIDRRLAAQGAALEAIAQGHAHPATYANAARLYMNAALACTEISIAAQNAIEEFRTVAPDSPSARTHVARTAIDMHRARVIEPLLDAVHAAHCTFPTYPSEAAGGGLIRAATIGINGAVRMLLADAFSNGAPIDPDAREKALVAALAVVRHLASGQSYAHTLAAQQVLRDLTAPLDAMLDDGALDTIPRARLGHLIDSLQRDDPLGFRRAFAAECAWLASQTFVHHGSAAAAFDRVELEALQPNQLAFLLASLTPQSLVPFDLPPRSPLEGALVDIRPWFDIDAFRRATRQVESLRRRALRQSDSNARGGHALAEDASPLAWLDVTTPVDIAAKTAEADADIARLREILHRVARRPHVEHQPVDTPVKATPKTTTKATTKATIGEPGVK